MTNVRLSSVVRDLYRVSSEQDTVERTDGDLLESFSSQQEPRAFATIVERHGSMVLGVCRRLLQHTQDAEDVFQATFLVLARQAESVRKRGSLASWLHGVSYRIALKVRREQARRRTREQRTTRSVSLDPVREAASRELQAILDEEIQRLPTIYREVFVHCCLEGMSKREASNVLELKEGTVSSRLAQARKRLQQQLVKRGITVGGGVAALLSTSVARASLCGVSVASATEAAILVASGSSAIGTVTARALSLAEGATTLMLTTKAKVVCSVLGALGLLLTALVVRASVREQTAPGMGTPPRSRQAIQASKPESADERSRAGKTIRGRVLSVDKKPVGGAKIFVWDPARKAKSIAKHRTVTDAKGTFELHLTEKEAQTTTLFAKAENGCPDWIDARTALTRDQVTFRLIDDTPIEGRILDLEGNPVKGAAIEVGRIETGFEDSKLDKWLAFWIETSRPSRRLRGDPPPMKRIDPAALGFGTPLKTDKDGRVRLRGIGSERVVHLRVVSPGLEKAWVLVVARLGADIELPPQAYHAKFSALIGPGKEMLGTVIDRHTKKPVKGIRVSSGSVQARTDEKGKYRLVGLSKRERHRVSTYGGGYFSRAMTVADTPGVQPVRVDLEIERGLLVKGHMTDKTTGKPIRGRFIYVADGDNPNLKNYTTFGANISLIPSSGASRPDGTFTAFVIPGRGKLLITAEERNRYIPAEIADWDGSILEAVPSGFHPSQFHAVVSIDAVEGKPDTLECNIALESGVERKVTLLGPDGKPVSGAYPAGATPIPSRQPYRALPSERVILRGLNTRKPRKVVFYHKEKQLGILQSVSGASTDPLTIQLRPLGGLKARVVDSEGRPLDGLRVTVELTRYIAAYKDLPWEILRNLGPLAKVELVTAKDGTFEAKGLIPGLKYNLMVTDGELRPGVTIHVVKENLIVESGKSLSLDKLVSRVTKEE